MSAFWVRVLLRRLAPRVYLRWRCVGFSMRLPL
jgi:hypothetical protein